MSKESIDKRYKLTMEAKTRIKNILLESPLDYGFIKEHWDNDMLVKLIEDLEGIVVSTKTAQRLLREVNKKEVEDINKQLDRAISNSSLQIWFIENCFLWNINKPRYIIVKLEKQQYIKVPVNICVIFNYSDNDQTECKELENNNLEKMVGVIRAKVMELEEGKKAFIIMRNGSHNKRVVKEMNLFSDLADKCEIRLVDPDDLVINPFDRIKSIISDYKAVSREGKEIKKSFIGIAKHMKSEMKGFK